MDESSGRRGGGLARRVAGRYGTDRVPHSFLSLSISLTHTLSHTQTLSSSLVWPLCRRVETLVQRAASAAAVAAAMQGADEEEVEQRAYEAAVVEDATQKEKSGLLKVREEECVGREGEGGGEREKEGRDRI